MSDLLGTMVSEFAGGFPDVPFAPGVDAEGIRAEDANPMFVTLPLLKVGGKSQNGFTWGEKDVMRVMQEINSKKPEGILGHVAPEERSTRYELPKLRWVGAHVVRGTLWGKAYVPQYAQDAREYFRLAKRTGSRVGTSVYGLRGSKGLEDMTVESIDLGHPDRLGLPEAAAVPKITSEMTNGNDNQGDKPMTDGNELKLVSELTTARDGALRQVSELTTKLGEKDKVISEMQVNAETLGKVSALVAEFAGADVTAKIGTLVSEVKRLQKQERQAKIDGVVAEMVTLEDLRPIVLAELGDVADEEAAKKRVAELLNLPHIKVVAEALTARAAGPSALISAGNNKPNTPVDMVKLLNDPKFIEAARAQAGF